MTATPLLVMIHGFRGTREGLALIAKHLPDVELVIPDLPGFGEGPIRDSYTLDAYVDWLRGFIVAQPRRPHLLGHSFGSIVASAYAARYPDTIDRLILVNPIGAPALEGPRAILSKLAVAYYWIGKQLPATLGTQWLSSKPSVLVMSHVMAKTNDRSLRQFIHRQHLQHFSRFHSPASVYEGFKTSISHSVLDAADHIETPTLLIAGEKDDITPIEKQRVLLEHFTQAQLLVIKDVGHLTHYETPEQVAAAVYSFIKEV